MTTELDALDEQLASIISPIAQLREDLIAQRLYHREQIASIDVRLTKLNRVLNAVNSDAKPGPKPKQQQQRDSNQWTPSDIIVQEIISALNLSETPLSTASLAELTGRSETTIHKALANLRSQEIVRQAGVEPSPLRKNVHRKIYALMPTGGINGSTS